MKRWMWAAAACLIVAPAADAEYVIIRVILHKGGTAPTNGGGMIGSPPGVPGGLPTIPPGTPGGEPIIPPPFVGAVPPLCRITRMMTYSASAAGATIRHAAAAHIHRFIGFPFARAGRDLGVQIM